VLPGEAEDAAVKVLLINPPRENEILGNNPAIIEEERGHNPPLGLLYLASYLLENSAHDVSVTDAQVEGLSYPALQDRIRAEQPDVVGMTAMTMTLLDVLKTAALVRQFSSSVPVVLGGPHVHLYPEETVSRPEVDYLVLGEGEVAFKELLDALGDTARLREVQGIAFLDQEEYVNTGIRAPIDDLDSLPIPARQLVPYKKYSSLLSQSGAPVTTIFTSRGCPFKCAFCDRPHLGKTFRSHSSSYVVDEMEACTKLGITDFLVYDDTFTVNRQRVLDICDEILRRNLNIKWDIRARVDTVNEEMVEKLSRAGCNGIHYGIEAGTEHVLRTLNKGITLAKASSAFRLTRRCGIPILAYFMIGNPGETREDIMTTFEVMIRLDPDYVHMTVLTPFPGTQIYFDGLRNGIIDRDYWREFARNPTPDFVPPHWGEHFTRQELHELLAIGYKRFYTRPSYIFRRICKLRSWGELRKKALAGIKVFLMR
jgi:radical SAM superfamily enzyme YgiQ (UPF0313 family)